MISTLLARLSRSQLLAKTLCNLTRKEPLRTIATHAPRAATFVASFFACGQFDPSRERFQLNWQGLSGNALPTGPLPPLLGRVLRAELRSLDTVGGFYRIEIDWLRWNWFDGSNISGIKPTESNRYAAALQQGWRGPLPSVATALKKSEFGFLPHLSCSGHPCPGSGYDVHAASMPPGTLGMNREPRVESPLEHGLEVRTWHSSIGCPGGSTRLLIIRRSSPPSRRRTRGPPETALTFQPFSFDYIGL